MRTIEQIENLRGVKVLLRADFNVPIKNGMVVDDYRIRAALPTLRYLREHGAKVIIVSHLEVNSGEESSLKPVAEVLNKIIGGIHFIEDYGTVRDYIDSKLGAGECVLLENLRHHEGEKKNDRKFAKELAGMAQIYVNDAFPVCHREHASIVGVPKYIPGYVGFQVRNEIDNLSKAFSPNHPFLFILGGAKFETKVPLLKKFIKIADSVFVGGALANDFYKCMGLEIGQSTFSTAKINCHEYAVNPKVFIPVDVVIQDGTAKTPDSLGKNDRIMDAGPATTILLKEKISTANFILWNGPLGLYEDGYRGPTLELAKMIGEATLRGATTIVGGGDTVASISALGIEEHYTFISTAGGAMLDFLAKGTLPGLEAIK